MYLILGKTKYEPCSLPYFVAGQTQDKAQAEKFVSMYNGRYDDFKVVELTQEKLERLYRE